MIVVPSPTAPPYDAYTLSQSDIEKIDAFLSQIHKFDELKLDENFAHSAGVSSDSQKEILIINPGAWKQRDSIDKAKLSAQQKGILLHEAGHRKKQHYWSLVLLAKGEKGTVSEETAKNSLKNLLCKFEVEAHEWAMNYALDKNWQDVYRWLVRSSIETYAGNRQGMNDWGDRIVCGINLGKDSEIYSASGAQLLNVIQKCQHKNFNTRIARFVEKMADKILNEAFYGW